MFVFNVCLYRQVCWDPPYRALERIETVGVRDFVCPPRVSAVLGGLSTTETSVLNTADTDTTSTNIKDGIFIVFIYL